MCVCDQHNFILGANIQYKKYSTVMLNHCNYFSLTQPILSDISAYSSTVDQAKAMGQALISESDAEEKQKIEARLQTLESEFSNLQQAAQTRMSRLKRALRRATAYEDGCGTFEKWLCEAEEKLSKMDPLSVASQPLRRQLEEVKGLVQEVESHESEMEAVTKSELDVFDTEMSSVILCEEHVVKSASSSSAQSPVDKPVLPDWLERPGAPEAIEVGAHLRERFGKLQLAVDTRRDEATQLMEGVELYEAEFQKFSEWLEGEKSAIASFAPPTVTVDEIKSQIEETEVR